ncbi:MAG: shikimate kinase [bacterium]|nr:shikimate kinase [bacterium]
MRKRKLGRRNLYLVAMAGSGKSKQARLLGARMGREVVDMDAAIEASEGCRIHEIFDDPNRGQEYFRALETKLLSELSLRSNLIVSTGGGIVGREENRNMLRTGVVVYLRVPFAVMRRRAEKQKREKGIDRPLFRNIAAAKRLFKARIPLYESVANVQVRVWKETDADVVTGKILKGIGWE